ncbi:MAG: hypothetical protein ACD_33C00005G0012 [uncultured bacterium]|nr:MAG: hypothetical protein ACD_33C00005G0012 [uncultured bacterium]
MQNTGKKAIEICTSFEHSLSEEFFSFLKEMFIEDDPKIIRVKITYNSTSTLNKKKLKNLLLTILRRDLDSKTNMNDVNDIREKNAIFIVKAKEISEDIKINTHYTRDIIFELDDEQCKHDVRIKATRIINTIYNESTDIINYQ